MEHFWPSEPPLHKWDSQSTSDVHDEPRPLGKNTFRMQPPWKHWLVGKQSLSIPQPMSGTCALRNLRSASVRVSALNTVQLSSANDPMPTNAVAKPI
jgi:hypothetical protein